MGSSVGSNSSWFLTLWKDADPDVVSCLDGGLENNDRVFRPTRGFGLNVVGLLFQ